MKETISVPCDVGEYHNTATDTCLPSPKNTTGPNIGATKCNSCGGDKSVTAGIGSRSDSDCIGETGLFSWLRHYKLVNNLTISMKLHHYKLVNNLTISM